MHLDHEHPLGAKAAAKRAAERKAKGDTTFDVQVGEKYVGQFNNSQRRGKGQATYANGDVYKVGAIGVLLAVVLCLAFVAFLLTCAYYLLNVRANIVCTFADLYLFRKHR